MYKNIKDLFSSKYNIFGYWILVIILASLWYLSTDFRIMFWNYGYTHTYFDISLSIIIILLFPVLIVSIIYKSLKYWKRADIELKTINWVISATIGTIISGASCCGATLATYFGLLPIMSFLPYSGLELKIIGVLGLIYGLHNSIKHLNTCHIKK